MIRCERCGTEEAVVRITRIDKDGRAFTIHLGGCADCVVEAHKNLPKKFQTAAGVQAMLKEQALLKKLLEQQGGGAVKEADESEPAPQVAACTTCGLSWSAYKQTSMLGCPDCYESFGAAIAEEIRRFQRATEHVAGAAPVNEAAERQERLAAMRAELKEALEDEDYERAAWLRDEIGRLEKGLEATERPGKAT